MIFRAVLTGNMYGQLCQNVLHFHKPDAVWPADANLLATDLRDNWLGGANGVRTQQNDRVTWTEIRIYESGNSSNNPVTLAVSLQGTDGNGSTQLLSYVSYVLRIRALAGGRHGRGRIYIPGARFGFFINGTLSASALTSLQPLLNQLSARYLPPGNTSTFTLGIAKRDASTLDDFQNANSLTWASVSGVQRRRNVGVGI